eukprot:Pgem_evm1s1392
MNSKEFNHRMSNFNSNNDNDINIYNNNNGNNANKYNGNFLSSSFNNNKQVTSNSNISTSRRKIMEVLDVNINQGHRNSS